MVATEEIAIRGKVIFSIPLNSVLQKHCKIRLLQEHNLWSYTEQVSLVVDLVCKPTNNVGALMLNYLIKCGLET